MFSRGRQFRANRSTQFVPSLTIGALALAAALSVTPARAGDPAAAEVLFRQGRQLLDSGQVDAACDKFRDSQALDPSSGTLLNLAACHLKQEKTSTAWAEFLAAARLARSQGKRAHEEEATRQASALESELSYLTLKVASPVSGLEVRRDGELVQPSLFGTRVPIDPGPHTVTASAPGYESQELSAHVAKARDEAIVSVPALTKLRTTSTPPPPSAVESLPPHPDEAQPARAHGSNSTLGWVVVGSGAGALIAGGVFGVLALSTNKDADKRCPSHQDCDSQTISLQHRRDTQALIADIGVGVGLAAIGVGSWIILSQPKRETGSVQQLRATATVLPGGGGLTMSGKF